jgi:hypothetical protein
MVRDRYWRGAGEVLSNVAAVSSSFQLPDFTASPLQYKNCFISSSQKIGNC